MTAEFISICILICKRHFVKFIVAPSEADMQVGRTTEGGIPVCHDLDGQKSADRSADALCRRDEGYTSSVLLLQFLWMEGDTLVRGGQGLRHIREWQRH